MIEGNLTCVRVPSPWNVLTSNVLVLVLKRNIANTRFLLACNVVVGSMLVFVLHVKLTLVIFLPPCNVVIGNMLLFGLETMLDFFFSAILLLSIWLFMIEGNLARVRFPSPWECYWKCACVWARSCARFIFLYNIVVVNLVVYYKRKYSTC